MTSICSSKHHLSKSKRRLKPSILRDYLLDDLSSCSSNGFKSFPRHLSAEIKRSEILHHNRDRRLTCGLPLIHALRKASTLFLNAVKLLPFPSISVKSPSPSSNKNKKKGIFSRSFWKNPSSRKVNVETEEEIQQSGHISPTGEATLSNAASESSSSSQNDVVEATLSTSFSSELLANSEEENDVVETVNGAVMESGDCVGTRVSDGSSVHDNREECEHEEKEQLSPISILECPFEDDSITPSHLQEEDEKKLMRKSTRFESLIQLEPVDLEKSIEQYYNSHLLEPEENLSENRAERLFRLVKSRLIEEPNYLSASHNIDSVVLDFFKEEGNNIDEDKLVKIVEEWVMRRQEEIDMFMSWDVRDIYVKEMRWGCIHADGSDYVVEELENSFVIFLIHELILDISL